jgi:pyruvate formate lyase activating enzyme
MTSVTVFDIKRFAVHDGPGIRTTVFMKGCPLDCWWCHNPESRSRELELVRYKRKLGDREVETTKAYGNVTTIQQVMREVLKDKIFYEESGGGVTFSGGDPLYQPEALYELLKSCSNQGLHTTIDTCGYAEWKVFEKILPFTELFLFDLKSLNPEKHKKFTGVRHELILSNLKKLLLSGAMVELRIPCIPGVNNDQEEINEMLRFLEALPGKAHKIHLLAYHEIAENKYKKLEMENRMNQVATGGGVDITQYQLQLEAAGYSVGIAG